VNKFIGIDHNGIQALRERASNNRISDMRENSEKQERRNEQLEDMKERAESGEISNLDKVSAKAHSGPYVTG